MNLPFHLAPAYKFCSADTLVIIVQRERLRFTRADVLNDIFELSPYLLPLNWEEIVALSKTDKKAAVAIAQTAFQKACSSLYVTCFSKQFKAPSSQLMWAHYASSHCGVCFCIDFSSMRKEDKGPFPVEVQYAPSMLAERKKYAPGSPDIGKLIGATKSSVWSYEEEVRLVVETDSFDPSKFSFVNDRKNIDVVFNPECITKVVFGMKTGPDDYEKVAKAFSAAGHLPDFTRLDLDPLTLEVEEHDLGIKKAILDAQPKS